MEFSSYIAVLCEGTAEEVIINILLDNDCLIFDRTNLIEEKPLRVRSAKNFENTYLRKGFKDKISVVRILDSKHENFKLSKAYTHKVDIINIITAPEIEMLIILSEGKYSEYRKSKKKPSDFCIQNLQYSDCKSKEFLIDYFKDSDKLVEAIIEHNRITKKGTNEYFLFDILKK